MSTSQFGSFVEAQQASTAKTARGAGPAKWIGDLAPIGKADWSYDRAAHLLERAGFGGAPEEIERLAAMTPQQAVNYLVDYEKIDVSSLPPFEESGVYDQGSIPKPGNITAEAIREAYSAGQSLGVKANAGGPRRLQPIVSENYYQRVAERLEVSRLAQWWASRMIATPRPLEEKMALFWHDHFATSHEKVRYYRSMKKQNEMFRRLATGNFPALLVAVSQDPAMLYWLDNCTNVKGKPNENYAREIFELFSLGVGAYTETDIREAARAFTGWTYDHLSVAFVNKPELHDEGKKTILGETGAFNGYDVVDIILRQPVTARFMARKLHHYFAGEEISPALEVGLADALRKAKYEFKPLLKTLFLSKHFYSPACYANQVKSPVVMAVSTFRKLGLKEVPGIPDFRTFCQVNGQELFFPPNVAGWDWGMTWINPATLIDRGNYIWQAMFPETVSGPWPDRHMPENYQRLGRRLAEGKMPEVRPASEGAMEGGQVSMINKINNVEDYNLGIGVYYGYVKGFERVKPIKRTAAPIDLVAMVRSRNLKTAEEIIAHFERRFLRVPLPHTRRQTLVEFLNEEMGGRLDLNRANAEATLRSALHLILSAPEYQLS